MAGDIRKQLGDIDEVIVKSLIYVTISFLEKFYFVSSL